MSARRRWPGPRAWLACALAVVAFGLSGCVYLRLLQLKRQLGEFDRHFTLETQNGVRLHCLDPILHDDDMEWLGFVPTTVAPVGSQERWHLRWLKQSASTSRETGNFEIAFDLFFAEGKLAGLWIPEKYFSALPKAVVVDGIRSLGGASVDKSSRSVESDVRLALGSAGQSWPTRETIRSVLGEPTELVSDAPSTWRYHFVSADPARDGKDIDLHFVFDVMTGNLIQARGQLPVGRINLKFTDASR